MWGYSSWRKSHEERILAGIVAKGGQFTRSTTPFQQWVSQFAFLGLRLKFEGVLNDFSIPEPTDEELAYVAGKRSTVGGLAILDSKIDDRLLKTLSKMPNLRRLVLFNCSVGDPELEQIIDGLPNPEKLGVLNLKGTRLTDRGLTPLLKLSGLHALIVDQSAIDGSGVLNLPAKQVVWLGLMNCNLNDSHLPSISKQWGHSLQTLDLSNTRISNEGLKSVVASPRLVNLRIGGTSVDAVGLGSFLENRKTFNFRGLDHLSLAGFHWTIDDLKKINLPPSLRELDLSNWSIEDKDVAQLPIPPSLDTLRLSGANISDACLTDLAGFGNLKRLHLHGTDITDKGLEFLTKPNRINFLEVGKTKISFDALMSRRYLSGLMELDVSGMNLTLEELNALAKIRPRAAVYSDDRTFKRSPFDE